MTSPTPTSDPVAASPTPTVLVPLASDRPEKPIMGDIVSLSRDDWSAWTGGKPAPGWVGLDPSAARDLTSPNQLRPVHAAASQKGYNFRRTGMSTLFTQASSLIDFQNAVWDHLTDCGMDTIAYLPDPENAMTMSNVVKSHSRYTVATAKALSSQQLLLYDKYDKTNDLAATKFLLSSLDPALMSKIKEKMEDDDSFHVVWLQLIKTIQSTSIERFEDLKAAIKARHPSQYAGENLEALAADYRKDARELTTAGQYDHNLTLTMLKTFLLAGGAGNEDYRFPLRSTKQKLDQALLDIGYKEKSGAHAHMVAEKLTFQDICGQAEDAYRTQFDRKEWPPASHAPDVRAPSATFGNVATTPAGITRAEVLTLIQSQGPGTETSTKKGNCHKCGKPGHWANKCPELASSSRKTGTSGSPGYRQDRTNKHKSWRTIPPPPGTANSKKIKDKTFHWCEKCRRWTVTHTTATHTGGERRPPAPAPRANLSMLMPDPSVWIFDFPIDPAPLNIIRGANVWFLLALAIGVCSLLPSLVSLAIFLSSAIPWSTILAWVANTLHQVVLDHPTLALAPTLWIALFFLSLWPPSFPDPPLDFTTTSVPFTRPQRRRFSRILKKSFQAPPRFNAGIRANKLHRSYPLRLRQQGHVVASSAPTIAQRNDFKNFATLKDRALRLQRCADKLRHVPRRAPLPPTTGQKGEKNNRRKQPSWVRKSPRPALRNATYCPVAAAYSPNPFALAPLTSRQRAAANKILSHVHLACHSTPLRMALQAPARMRDSLGPDANTSPIIWDSGASISITPDLSDFHGPVTPPGKITQLKGIAKGLQIKGQGEVSWAVHDQFGNLRIIKVPAYHVPNIKVRLLSTTSLLQTYPDETITIEPNRLTLSGVANDSNRGPVTANVNPQNNLPTSEAYNGTDPFKAADALVSIVNTVHEQNLNLTEAEKELLRWHYRLGHVGFKKVQFLLRSGVVSKTEESRRLQTAACRLTKFPKCAACQYGKQHRRPIPGTTPSSVVKDRAHALKTDNLLPGQRISVDHFICSTRGRLLTSAGKTKLEEMYTGGCIFVDHASGYIFVEHQVSLNSHETLKAKESFERMCRNTGVVPQEFLADNSKTFTSAEFSRNLANFQQVIRFAGVGAHHHNGIAERNIRTIMAIARTMMLHSAIHWPDVADPTLWPLAVKHAVFLVNHMPDPRTGLSPSDVFTKTRWEQGKFSDVHVWGCPVYVLDKMISDGKKLPRWSPRSTRTINLGFSDKHASSVPLVLNPQTGYITPQFHIVFDDWFATVSASADDLPNFNDASWQRMFKDSTYQYVLDDEDEERLIVEASDYEQAQDLLSRMQRVSTAIDASTLPQVLPVAPPPLATPLQPPREQVSTPVPAAAPLPHTTPLLTPREATPQAPSPIDDTRPPTPTPIKLFQAPPTPVQPVNESVIEARKSTFVPKATKAKSTPVKHEPRRSTRNRSAPLRLGYDGQQGHGYNAELNGISLEWLYNEVAECPLPPPTSYKASASDPDTLSFIEAMNDVENFEKWMNAANDEIQSLEKNGTWKEVSISEAKTRILPGTWVFRRKRTPDGTISKYKARYCVRGDLQEVIQDTFAPVVAWSTVRLFLVLSLTLDWKTCTIDFSSAFVQAPLADPVWIQLPRGFRSEQGSNTCLRLLKSLYGLSVAPRLWYQHLSEALREEGFKPCANDPCLLFKDTIMVVLYVDDLGIAYSNQSDLEKLFANLESKSLSFTREGTFTDFLGINFTKNPTNGTLTLTQKGLIQKIVDATGMSDSNYNWTPAAQAALGIDPDGPPMNESWSYRSTVGMLLYLSTNTRPDIAFAVSQVARFSHNPKKSHASAVKTLVRYLHRTCDMGMIVKPTGNLNLDCYVDADFAGLHGRDPDRSPSSAKSRTGYIITLGGCPILWKSHLQSEISLSTLEAEYSALSSAMRTLLPLRSMLMEIVTGLKLPHTFLSTISCQVFEDNNGALLLAVNQRITNRTKYFQVKWHFFWEQVRNGTVTIVKVDTQEQWADFLTKGLNRESFERVRKLVQGW